MSQSFVEIWKLLSAALRIHAFLKLGICVKREDVMLLLFLRSMGRVVCGFFESFRCFVALLISDVWCDLCQYNPWPGTMLVMTGFSHQSRKCSSHICINARQVS